MWTTPIGKGGKPLKPLWHCNLTHCSVKEPVQWYWSWNIGRSEYSILFKYLEIYIKNLCIFIKVHLKITQTSRISDESHQWWETTNKFNVSTSMYTGNYKWVLSYFVTQQGLQHEVFVWWLYPLLRFILRFFMSVCLRSTLRSNIFYFFNFYKYLQSA